MDTRARARTLLSASCIPVRSRSPRPPPCLWAGSHGVYLRCRRCSPLTPACTSGSDAYPLCADLGDRHFLRRGARYSYLGTSPKPRQQFVSAYTSGAAILLLNRSTSALHHRLCHSGGGSAGAPCNFRSEVILDASLGCDSDECDVETAVVVGVIDRSDSASVASRTVYFEYVAPPCTTLTFTQGATQRLMKGRMCGQCNPIFTCDAPESVIGGAVCCSGPNTNPTWPSGATCVHPKQAMSYPAAKARCAAEGRHVCWRFKRTQKGHCEYADGSYGMHQWIWVGETCAPNKVQVDSTGLVTLVHPSSTDPALKEDSGNLFNVRWAEGRFPTVEDGHCSALCEVSTDTCLCDVNVTTSAVFTDGTNVPSAEILVSQLHIGSAAPETYDVGTYVQCTTSACLAADDGVEVFLFAASSPPSSSSIAAFDVHTIFRVTVNATRVLHLRNKASTVTIGRDPQSPLFSFRNPPKLMKFTQPSARDAQYETTALLEHLFYHPNVAPFIATRLIQRFVSSNPSPRYTLAVSSAFATGRVGGRVYSGAYGDLGAALAATLLDREARSMTLDVDPTHGALREPFLKLLHVMRSLEYVPRGGREIELASLSGQAGMQAYRSPTVFSFFLPEFEPDGPIASAGLVSPESELATGPFMIGALNGISSLIRYGLTTCDDGFGSANQGTRACDQSADTIRDHADGELSYVSTPGAHTDEIVAELDMLLTSGRLHPANRARIVQAYDDRLEETGSAREAMRMAQELITLAPEFHTTTTNSLRDSPRASGADSSPSLGRPYKALVFVNLGGGVDSFNVLVPHSNCVNASGGAHDLYEEYKAVRGEVIALPKDTLRTLDATGSHQVCGTFGVHPVYKTAHDLYRQERPEAAFIANVGPLVEPTSQEAYRRRKEKGVIRLPPGLFGALQERHSHSMDVCSSPPYRCRPPPNHNPIATAQSSPPHRRRAMPPRRPRSPCLITFPICAPVSFDCTAHNVQQKVVQVVHAQETRRAKGIIGRLLKQLNKPSPSGQPKFSVASYSTSGSAKILEGGPSRPYVLPRSGDPLEYNRRVALRAEVANLTGTESGSIFAESFAEVLETSIADTVKLRDALQQPLSQTYSGGIAPQMKQVAKVIKAQRNGVLATEREAFYVSQGGFDSHYTTLTDGKLAQIENGLAPFVAEMKALGMWDNVTVVVSSEFGRTLTWNGRGTDHGWGGNTFLMGGQVRGGVIHGKFPTSLGNQHELSAGRGRIIPTTSWESVWHGLGEWLGLEEEGLHAVLPNLKNFQGCTGTGCGVLTAQEMFR